MKKYLLRTLPYIGSAVIIACYMLLTINRYLPVQDGWFQYYSMLLVKGQYPYKDFFYYMTPGYLYFFKLQYAIFGSDFLYYRIYGVFERVAIAWLMLGLLSKYFSRYDCFLAVTFGFFAYAGFNLDYPDSYYQTVFLIFMLSTALLYSVLHAKSAGLTYFYVILLGVSNSFLFLFKQSTGVVCLFVFSIYLVVSIWDKSKIRETYAVIGIYLLSMFFILGGVIFWLHIHDALPQFFHQVFGSSSAKGSPFAILTNGVIRSISHLNFFAIICLAVIFYAYKKIDENTLILKDNVAVWLTTILFFMASYYVPFIVDIKSINYWSPDIADKITSIIFISICFICFISFPKRKESKLFDFIFYISFWAMIWMYTHGTSGVIEIPSAWLALSMCTLLLLRGFDTKFTTCLLIGLGCYFILLVSSARYKTPYAWWGWFEPDVRIANVSNDIPGISKFELSNRTNTVYNKIYNDIMENTGINDQVFAFPHMQIFNVITGRLNNNFTPVTWFDVCPDKYAKSTAQWIETDRPKIIVYMRISKTALDVHEKLFRNGNPSGQRAIIEKINNLIDSGEYRVIDSFDEDDGEFANFPIDVLLRSESVPNNSSTNEHYK